MRLTDVLAIYGASLSTVTAVWNYFRTQSQIRVRLIRAFETTQGEYQDGMGISVQNVSAQTIHITSVSFLVPIVKSTLLDKLKHFIRNKRIPRNHGWGHSSLSLHGIDHGCPVSIESGKSHWIFVRHEVLDKLLESWHSRRFKAVVQDALWRNTYSNTFDYPKLQIGSAQKVND